MTTLTVFFAIFTSLYVGQCLLFIYGLKKEKSEKNYSFEPKVSIVTAARNEEKNIHSFLESLASIDYPSEKLEIIVVDDNSTDATPKIIKEFVSGHPGILTLTAQLSKDHLRGKANAIAQGIDRSTGEIILMTDADCVVQPSWVRATAQNFGEKTGVVAGLTLLQPGGWFAGMQSLDWAYILAVASAAMSLNNPLSCIGNNFSFRRSAYDEVGGYRGTKFSVTEDFALFKAITESGRWGYRYPFEKETLVFSRACSNMTELYRQKRRWGVGGKDMPISGMAIMVIAFCMHTLMLASPFVGINTTLLLSGVLLKVVSDFLLIRIPLVKTEQTDQLKYFALFQLYYIVYVIMLPFAVFLGGRVVWKGRKY